LAAPVSIYDPVEHGRMAPRFDVLEAGNADNSRQFCEFRIIEITGNCNYIGPMLLR
jgi:hypothetical protein